MPRGIAPGAVADAIVACSSSRLAGRESSTGAAGPPPHPVTRARARDRPARGPAVSVAAIAVIVSGRCVDAEPEQDQPHDPERDEPAISEEQLLGRLAVSCEQQRAVPGQRGGERNDRERAPWHAIDDRQL